MDVGVFWVVCVVVEILDEVRGILCRLSIVCSWFGIRMLIFEGDVCDGSVCLGFSVMMLWEMSIFLIVYFGLINDGCDYVMEMWSFNGMSY